MATESYIDVTPSQYEAFLPWDCKNGRLYRDVQMFYEPPFENFLDTLAENAVVCSAMLMSEYPSLGIADPRPADQRPNSWWRTNCRIRTDWHQRWEKTDG